MKEYNIPVEWTMTGLIQVYADSIHEAIDQVLAPGNYDVLKDGEYLSESLILDVPEGILISNPELDDDDYDFIQSNHEWLSAQYKPEWKE